MARTFFEILDSVNAGRIVACAQCHAVLTLDEKAQTAICPVHGDYAREEGLLAGSATINGLELRASQPISRSPLPKKASLS